MSIDRCAKCSAAVDTDYDDECYGEFGDEECMCKPCRDREIELQEQDQKLDDPRHGQARWLNRKYGPTRS